MPNRDRLLSILLLLVVITAAVFWQVRGFDFINIDDNVHIYENPYFAPVTLSNLGYFWRHFYEGLYVPVAYTVWGLVALAATVVPDVEATQAAPLSQWTNTLDPSIFHSANLLFHVFNVLLVFAILRLLVKSDWPAAFGALLFGLHPVQVESVVWVSELRGVLSGFFSLLALWIYLRAAISQSDEQKNARSKIGLYLLATLAFVLALLSKPSAAAVPLVLLVIESGFLKRAPRRYLPYLLPWLALVCVVVLLTRSAQPVPDILQLPLWQRVFIAGDTLSFYLYQLVYPLRLAVHYSRTPAWVLSHSWVYLQWLIPAAILALAWWRRKRTPTLASGVGILFVTLLPVSGLVPFIFQLNSTVADRYLYFAMLGPALALSGITALVFPRAESPARPSANGLSSYWPVALCSLALLLCGALSIRQLSYWASSQRLYEHTLVVNPRSWGAHINLGLLLEAQNKTADAALHYREAIRLDPASPSSAVARVNLGGILESQGKLDEATTLYQDAVNQNTSVTSGHYHLGIVMGTKGDFSDAAAVLRQGAQQKPAWAQIRVPLALALIQLGKVSEGKAELAAARQMRPRAVDPVIITVMEKWAAGKAGASLRRSPGLTLPWAQAYNNRGMTYLGLGKPQPAAASFRKAIDAKPDYAEALFNLGAALAQQNKKVEAIGFLRRALRAQPDMNQAQKLLDELADTKK